MADVSKIVRRVFNIPDWYVMCESEKEKLFRYIQEANCAQEARLFRILDCSAFCVEEKCFFCGGFAKQSNHQ